MSDLFTLDQYRDRPDYSLKACCLLCNHYYYGMCINLEFKDSATTVSQSDYCRYFMFSATVEHLKHPELELEG